MPGKPRKPAVDPKEARSGYDHVLEIVTNNPHAWLGCAELATLFRIPEPYVSAASKAKDTPFIGKSCHPDLLDAWLKSHPGLTV